MNIIDRLGRDPLVGSVLILYGLHPEDIETRVQRHRTDSTSTAQAGLRDRISAAYDGAIRFRAETGSHAAGPPRQELRRLWKVDL